MTKNYLFIVILLAFSHGYSSAQSSDAEKTLHNLPDSLQSDSSYIPSRTITEISTLVDETKIMPQSPTVGSITSYVDRPVSYFSGTAGIDVPLCTVKAYDIELPVSLSYGSTGCQPSQEASWVGLGWNLSLNACISRTVRCTDDFCEYISNGHVEKGYYKSDTIPSEANALPSSYFTSPPPSYDHSVYLKQDPEPDIFYFSFWGGSSKFIIDKYPGTGAQFTDKESGWKLQIVSGNTGYIFVLIAKDGTKYWFDKKEYTKSLSAAPRETSIFSSSQQPGDLPGITTYSEYTSSWFLSQIESPTGHVVNFVYEREYYVSPMYESCQSCYYNNGYVNRPLYYLSRSAVKTWRLKRIYWDNGSIEFWTSPREDVTANRYNYLMSLPADTTPSERLDSLAICDASGNTCRKFKMTYSYFNGSATGDSAFLYKRLKLDNVTEVTSPTNQYQFGYNTGSFPVKNTKNVDYWGYYNGADYQTLYYSVAWNGGTLNWGRVKSSVEQYASIGMLTSVTYPTGGTETFEYELNQFNGLGSITGTTVESSHRAMYAYNISQSPTNPMWQSDTVTFEKDAYLRIELQGTNYQTGDCLLRIYSGTQVIREYDCPWNLGPWIQHPKYETTLPAGTYIFEMPAPPRDGMVLSASIDIDSFTRPITGVTAVNGAGMRIKRITGGGRQRSFDYSLGVLLVDPIPGFLKIEYAPSEMHSNFYAQYFTQQSESVRPLMSMSHGNLVGYGTVTETDGVHKTVFMYHAYREMPPVPGHPMLPVYPVFLNGKPICIYKYDGDQIASETRYTYNMRHSDYISSFYVYPRTSSCIKSGFQITWHPFSQVADYLYDTQATNAAPMVNTTIYEIDDYLQHTRAETVRDNTTYSTTYKYVYDYPNDNVCAAMAAANILLPVEAIDYADSQITGGKMYVYQQTGNLFLPYKVRTLDISASVTGSNYTNHFHDDVVFNSFDSHGNVLQMTVKGMPVTYIWSYKGELPVAEIRNATYSQLSSNINFSTFCSKTSLSSQDVAQLNSLRSLYPSSEVTVLQYNNRHLVSEMTDPQGQKLRYEYDSQGRLTNQSVVIDGTSQRAKSYKYAISDRYIRERTYIKSDTSQYLENYRLFDGFGRPIAATTGGVLTSGNSLVEMVDYDEGGRQVREWLPVPADSSGIFGNLDGLRGYYNTNHGDTAAYTQTDYDGLDRVTRTWAPGSAFRSRPATTEYRLNEASDSVRHYSVPLFADNLVTGGFHAASQLRKVVTTDPDQRQVTQFIDKRGNTVLERRHNGDERMDTYYVYDVKGQLRMVLQPEYQRTQNLSRYAYRYRYDSRGRCNYRKLPGCGAVQYWFDTRDRVTAMQDSVLRSQGLYRVYTYDGLDRPLSQGLAASPTGTATTLELVNHYVSYDFVPAGYSAMAAAVTGSGSQPNTCPARLTGIWQKASDGSETLSIVGYDSYNRRNRTQTYGPYGLMQDDVTWYDFDGAVDSTATTVRRISDQGLVFSGTLHNHYCDTAHTRVLESSDLSVTDADGQTQDRTIQSLEYDDLGRVTSNDRGHNAVSMAYQYNPLRGWLTQISTVDDDGFIQKLYRENNTNHPLYNGSISAMEWKVPGQNFKRRYDYTYDGLNRLTEGAYSQSLINPVGPVINDSLIVPGPFPGGITPLSLIPVIDSLGVSIRAIDRYTERIFYDKNSNIIGIERYGMNNLRHYGLIDSLSITYTGNQRRMVTDGAGNLTYDGASDFVDGITFPQEYTYDGNGRLTKDMNRGIWSITYDLCNNPQAITFTGTNGIEYAYAPDGTRLRTVHKVSGIGGSVTRDTTDYLGNLLMRNGHLSMYQFVGGYVSFDNDTIDGWHYYIQDYMGNNRMVVNKNGTVEQVTHYYPYGGVIGDISTYENLQKYKFEGKELDRTFGLDNYDIHARQYFAMAPMWDRIDPLTEENPQFSPYSYCMGDPVNLGDYNGMIPTFEEGAALANHVYEGDKNEQVGDWTCISITVNKSNGLRYGIYSHKKKTGDIEYALVFAGTSDSKDWDTDKKQALGKLDEWQLSESGLMEKSQYGEAVDASISFLKDHNNQETTIVGHSLGGGLAAVGSMKTGIQCMTYNPAGLHENTIKNLGINQAPTEQIHNYVLFGEGVSILNKVMPNISVPGKTSYCFNTFSFSFSILTLYINHKIGSF